MNLDISNADEYLVTAAQIFDYYGADRRGKLRVDELMDKFPSYVKNNQYLKTLLDPDLSNQEISITMLAEALSKYSESQKTRIDLEESFNMKPGPGPQDSDSGISTDGPVLEDLQLELREKSHVARQLRNQLEFNDRQHEEVLATITAERDSLRAHLNMLRDENITLTHVRCDYEEACERLCNSDAALDDARRELDALRRRNALLHEQATGLEADKHTLQELLSKSKGECHRINEMYASRQSALLEQNESLRSQSADLASRLQDMEEVMQQLMSEKVHIEMELKDMLNKSNHTHLRLDRSIDVSYTEEQMLTALDSLNADSRMVTDMASVGTQASAPCDACVLRARPPPDTWGRRVWRHLKSLFSVFALLCFCGALLFLYNVSHYHYAARRCLRAPAVPWRWLSVRDLLDVALRIEYVGDVPM